MTIDIQKNGTIVQTKDSIGKNRVMDISFWRDKKVFLTGHTGFKGSWLALWLQELGAEVTGFSLEPPTQPNLFALANAGKNMRSIQGDIRDFPLLKATLLEHTPEIIIHMAAQSLVRYSYDNPIETYATNVMGTVNLLEAARAAKTTKVIINITSDKCYENKEWHWGYREEDKLGGHDPYSNSKACAELVTSAYRHSYYHAEAAHTCGLASVRAGNVIGGGDWALDRLIPDLMRSIINEEKFTIRYPHALRPWQHVLEPLQGYLQLAEYLYKTPKQYAEPWNFGPEDEDVKSVGWIVKKIQHLCNREINSETSIPTLHEAAYLKLDSSKAKNKLGWKPRWNLDEALTKTVDWYQAYKQGKDMNMKTREQINDYMSKEIL